MGLAARNFAFPSNGGRPLEGLTFRPQRDCFPLCHGLLPSTGAYGRRHVYSNCGPRIEVEDRKKRFLNPFE